MTLRALLPLTICSLMLVPLGCSGGTDADSGGTTPLKNKGSSGKGGSGGSSGAGGATNGGAGGEVNSQGGAGGDAGQPSSGAGGDNGAGGSGGAASSCDGKCTAEQACCKGVCIDTQSDPQNCGACSINCSAKAACIGGKCVQCAPGETLDCYSGPPGTEGVGLCKKGKSVCSADGIPGPCEGQVTPKLETCATPNDDDDCDGNTLSCAENEACDPVLGQCVDPCDPSILAASYIGCVYYPTVTPNQTATSFHFAIAVSNTNDSPTTVTITRGGTSISEVTVEAQSVQIVNLPWITELKGPASTGFVSFPSSVHVPEGAYKLVSTRPVTVYQYSPLEYVLGGTPSFTNDASLLTPLNAWRQSYIVAARGQFSTMSGFYTVVASQDNTTVTLKKGARAMNVKPGVNGIGTDNNGSVVMNEGDVITVVTSDAGQGAANDLTGTLVNADKPIQVFGGHQCTFIPDGVAACDHIEETMFPIDALAFSYLVAAPLIPNGNVPKANMVRMVATEDGTELTYDPPQPNGPTMIAQAGDWVEFQTDQSFQISSKKRFLLAQYMLGQQAGGGSGDPAMALAVPTAQYRSEYLFHAPVNYEKNFVTITAPSTATVNLDGAPVAGLVPVGNTGYSVTRIQLPNSNSGNHTVDSTAPVGITVYGYGQYTSYWYPGGLDLKIIKE